MRVVLVVQARMGSTRLPGKSMLDLAGAPLIDRVLERVVRCRDVHEVVLATTRKPEDDVLIERAALHDVPVYRGSEDDLVDRYRQAAAEFRADVVGRLPGDNPVPEPAEIDRIVRAHSAGECAFSSNLAQVLGNGYPDGIGAEMIERDALEAVWREVRDPRLREHPHLNFFDYASQRVVAPERFPVGTVDCPPEFRRPDIVLDVNTAEEYELMRDLYDALYPGNPHFTIVDVVRWWDEARQLESSRHG